MGLTETLGARAARQGRSAPVECGELGTLTVEALPVRELELLRRGADGNRAVFYVACRELQSAGEELRKAGKVFAPDGIMQFVSDGEAAAAARTVLELSGWTEKNSEHIQALNLGSRGREFNLDENRLQIVQSNAAAEMAENRLASVQEMEPIVPLTDGNRLDSVQFNGASAPAFGQVSRETEAESAEFDTVPESDKKLQAMGILPPERTQNVVSGESTPIGVDDATEAPGDALHEIMSEFGNALHETTSEFRGERREILHESMSEFRDTLHETTSEFGEIRRGIPHEIKSEFGDALHESTSEFRDGLHEITSEYPEKDRASLHETTSELAEAVARRLVEGLRRAKWVRGD